MTTIDFEDLAIDSALAFPVGSTYSHDGFTLTGVPFPGSSSTGELDYFGTLSNEFYGSTALLNCCGQDSVVLTRTDGGAFNLRSIDLIEVRGFNSDGSQADFGPGEVTFVGTKRNGRTVSYTATFSQFPAATEVDFTGLGFVDLLSVTWEQGPGGVPGPTHQFDNILVQALGR
jgi:hypothetical protein